MPDLLNDLFLICIKVWFYDGKFYGIWQIYNVMYSLLQFYTE